MKEKKYTEAELSRLHDAVERELKKIPGVVGVGFGIKEKNRTLTNEIAFRVYVREKKEESQLLTAEIIPKEIEGFKTDVLTIETIVPSSVPNDNKRHRPILGGIAIFVRSEHGKTLSEDYKTSVLKISPFLGWGTLGCFAELKKGGQTVLLSNSHVLQRGNINKGFVFQPQFSDDSEDVPYQHSDLDFETIAVVLDKGKMKHHHLYKYPKETETKEYYLDCEIARLRVRRKCGKDKLDIKYLNEINNFNLNGLNAFVDIHAIKRTDILENVPYKVYKVGATTGKTEGTVTDPFAVVNITYRGEDTSFECRNVIRIEGLEPPGEMKEIFADVGDSGSVVINADNKVIGLHFGSADSFADEIKKLDPNLSQEKRDEIIEQNKIEWSKGRLSASCHIHPVIDYLKITIKHGKKSTSSPSKRIGTMDEEGEECETKLKIDALIKSMDMDRHFLQAYEKNVAEITNLVNHNRLVISTWYRHSGPGFFAHLVKNVDNPRHVIPKTVKGIPLHVLLDRMRAVLYENGSHSLRKGIDEYGDVIIQNAADCNSLKSLLSFTPRLEHHE